MKSKPLLLVLLLLAALLAIGFRTLDLGRRPMHADESVQAAIFRRLWLDGEYTYNPHEFHGPTMPYATLPSAWLSGAKSFSETTETTYRLVPRLFRHHNRPADHVFLRRNRLARCRLREPSGGDLTRYGLLTAATTSTKPCWSSSPCV